MAVLIKVPNKNPGKRPDEEQEEEAQEQASAAEGPRALQEWAARPAKLPRNWKTQLAREKLKGKPEVIAESFTHKAGFFEGNLV